ncbi:MAG: hypothetical protein A2X36_13845 [Elusimicrobia bacterium GWA2_69_24]|nr:MAG: hypothetical protein A2X36_13845 [Elusimicrobia bacterium GWA2_69_24]
MVRLRAQSAVELAVLVGGLGSFFGFRRAPGGQGLGESHIQAQRVHEARHFGTLYDDGDRLQPELAAHAFLPFGIIAGQILSAPRTQVSAWSENPELPQESIWSATS